MSSTRRFLLSIPINPIFCYTVYTISWHLSDTCPNACETLAAALIYLLSIPFDLGLPCVRALGKLCKLVPYIGLLPREETRRGERSVCVAARARACMCVCPRESVCTFASCGFVVCPEGRTTSCLVLFARPFAPRLSGVTSPLTVPLPLPEAPRIDRQHACKHRCTRRT